MSLRIKESSRFLANSSAPLILLVLLVSVKSLPWQADRDTANIFARVALPADYRKVQADKHASSYGLCVHLI